MPAVSQDGLIVICSYKKVILKYTVREKPVLLLVDGLKLDIGVDRFG